MSKLEQLLLKLKELNSKKLKILEEIRKISPDKIDQYQGELSFNKNLLDTLSILRSTVDNSADGILVIKHDGDVITFNKKFKEIWGVNSKWVKLSLKERTDILIKQLKNSSLFDMKLKKVLKKREDKSYQFLEMKDGRILECYVIFYQSIDNQPAGRVWSFRDLTERRKREVELIQNRSFLKTIVKNAPVGIMVVDQDGKPIEINEQLLFMFQTDKKTFYNDTKFELILPIGDQLKETIKKIVEGKINSYRIVKEILKYDGTFFWGDISVSPIYDYNGKLSKIIAIFIDITKRKEMEIKLRNMAIIDPLTQLPNRRFFQSTVEKSIKRGDRKDSLVAILFLDLDGFKQINDKFGHEAGDKVLQKVAKRLKKSVREYDLVARIGGDEFTIILEDIENKKGIEIMAKRIIDMVSIPYELDENTGKVTVSIGISIFPKDDQNSTALIQKADEAMYVAKNMGKNRYVFYEELKR